MRIANRLRLLSISLVAVTATLIGLTVYWGYSRIGTNLQQRSLITLSKDNTARIESKLEQFRDDLTILAVLPDVEFLAQTPPETIPPEQAAAARDRIAATFAALIDAKPWYDQVRLITRLDQGREVVRVDRTAAGPRRTPEQNLQQKAQRDYMRNSAHLRPGEIYLSDINLNRERGQIETPHKPMLRGLAAIDDSHDTQWGVIVINVAFDRFAANVLPEASDFRHCYLTNHNGDYLVHPDPAMTFGFDLGTPHTLQNDFPSLAQTFSSPDEQMLARIKPTAEDPARSILATKLHIFAADDPRYLVFAVSRWDADLAANTAAIASRVVLITLGILVLSIIPVQYIARHIARPIERISAAARATPHQLDAASLDTDRTDEIGDLSRALESMMHALNTERQALQDAYYKLERSNHDLEHFAHIASHDLREPARRVAALADLLLASPSTNLTPESADLLRRLQASAIRMVQQLQDFRALTGIGHGEILRKPVCIHEIIRSVLSEFTTEIEQRRIHVEVHDLPDAEAYPELVTVLYRSLIQNAIQHTHDEGTRLELTAERTETTTLYAVRNTGSHIPDDDLERIFDPFTRLNSLGRGMGLSICRRIVERHGGSIHAESGDDWVRFTFSLESN